MRPSARSRLVALVLPAWGLFAMGMVPSLQYRVVSLADPRRRKAGLQLDTGAFLPGLEQASGV